MDAGTPARGQVHMRCSTLLTAPFFLCACFSVSLAEESWKYDESVDELTNESVRTLAIADETGQHFLVLNDAEGKMTLLLVTKGLGHSIFPDSVARPTVDITIRGSKTNAVVIPFSTIPQNLTTVKTAMKPGPARKLLGGEFVILGINKTGKRYKFPTSGDGREGLQEALDKIAPQEDSP